MIFSYHIRSYPIRFDPKNFDTKSILLLRKKQTFLSFFQQIVNQLLAISSSKHSKQFVLQMVRSIASLSNVILVWNVVVIICLITTVVLWLLIKSSENGVRVAIQCNNNIVISRAGSLHRITNYEFRMHLSSDWIHNPNGRS